MELSHIVVFALFGAIGGYFWRAQGARERALLVTRQYCQNKALQLLDETVGLSGLWLKRNAEGRMCLRRTYRFEFTATGEERYEGKTVLLGYQTEQIYLPPYRVDEESLH